MADRIANPRVDTRAPSASFRLHRHLAGPSDRYLLDFFQRISPQPPIMQRVFGGFRERAGVGDAVRASGEILERIVSRVDSVEQALFTVAGGRPNDGGAGCEARAR